MRGELISNVLRSWGRGRKSNARFPNSTHTKAGRMMLLWFQAKAGIIIHVWVWRSGWTPSHFSQSDLTSFCPINTHTEHHRTVHNCTIENNHLSLSLASFLRLQAHQNKTTALSPRCSLSLSLFRDKGGGEVWIYCKPLRWRCKRYRVAAVARRSSARHGVHRACHPGGTFSQAAIVDS